MDLQHAACCVRFLPVPVPAQSLIFNRFFIAL
jgi:hypothetical protein